MKNQFTKDDFGVIINNNAKEIVNFLHTNGYNTNGVGGNGKNGHFYFIGKGETLVEYSNFFQINPTSKSYTLEELQYFDYLSNQNKEIITYELLPEYEKFLPTLDKISSHFSNQVPPYKTGGTTSMYSLNFKEAGLLNIWFKPIYGETQKEFIMSDDFILKVKNKKVYHGSEEITDFVIEMGEWFNSIPEKFSVYKFKIADLIFSKTGCQNELTSIKQWMEIYNEIKEK